MSALFVPPPKAAASVELFSPEATVEATVLVEGELLESEIDSSPQPLLATPNTLDSLFFYGRIAEGDPVLYQVNPALGTLAIASTPIDLFPTALSGLFAAEPTAARWLQQPARALPKTESLETESLETESLETESLQTEPSDIALLQAESPGLAPVATAPLEAAEPGSLEAGPLAIPTAAATAEPPIFTLVVGTNDKNFLIGTAADNALFGFGGGDLILAGGGNNLAFGGDGNDTLIGGSGDDILFGGLGDDVLEGGGGNDYLFGGEGDDILYGGAGANVLVGGAGADIFRLGAPGAYSGAALGTPPDTIVDFSLAEGDRLDFSPIAAQPLFAGVELLPFLSFVQVGADTHVQVTTPLGQTATEAILLNVEADTITPSSLTFTTPAGLPLLK